MFFIWFWSVFLFSVKYRIFKGIVLFLFLSGCFSFSFHSIIQYSFKSYFGSYFDFPALNGLKDFKLGIMLFVKGIFFGGLILFINYYLEVTSEKQKVKLQIEQLQKENLEVQLLALKQQISPHFLFNSLSTLQTIVTEESSKNFILKLSEVYRYLLSFNENHLVTLQEELDFIESYIYILKERFEEALIVTINIQEELLSMQIPPLVLQLVVENAIKHNIVSFEDPLIISITTNDNQYVAVSNNLQLKSSVESSTKVGLENIKKRYYLLLNKEIEIVVNEEHFIVKLPLL
jgi:LytS/YehU family sensor histidine kinase